MTDNEIIKCAENCVSNFPPCSTCPYDGENLTSSECMNELMAALLEVVKRQQAEIEELKADKIIAERKEKDARALFEENVKSNSEAIKEFAEQIKMVFYYEFEELIPSIMADKIDNLVKEMTEGSI
jgi:Tfp pilus assembly protein PilN